MTVASIPFPLRTRPRWRTALRWSIPILVLLAAACFSLSLQHDLWNASEPIRFRGDITNAYNQGQRAHTIGVLNLYRDVAQSAQQRSDGTIDYGLDYPPLRLITAWLWYSWTTTHFPGTTAWQNTWAFHAPLLHLNRAFLVLAALSAFGLVLHFRGAGLQPATPTASPAQQPASPSDPTGRYGIIDNHYSLSSLLLATTSSLLILFSLPANLVGFAWPQWDIAVPAFFLAALLAGCRRHWLLCGVLLAIGGLYKGQLFISLPLFLLWPLIAGHFRGLLRLLIGFALAAGLITAPFMFQPTLWAVGTLAGICIALIGLGLLLRARSSRWLWLLILASALAIWPARAFASTPILLLSVALTAALFILAALLARRDLPTLLAAAIALSIWLPAAFTPEPWHWLHVGLLYGTHHFQSMHMGPANTFPALLSMRFAITRPDNLAFTLFSHPITWKVLLRVIFLTATVLCGIAMGIHDRRRNPRFLLAAITPWILFATIPAQIHERYGLYAALASAVLLALEFRWIFLHLAVTLISGATIFHALCQAGQPAAFLPQPGGPSLGQQFAEIVRPLHPDIAWAMLILSVVALFCALDLRRRSLSSASGLPPVHSANALAR